MKSRKIMAALMCAMLTAPLLAGCGDNTKTTTTAVTTAAATKAETMAPATTNAAMSKADDVISKAESKADEASSKADAAMSNAAVKMDDAKSDASSMAASLDSKAEEKKEEISSKADETASKAENKTTEVSSKADMAVSNAGAKIDEAKSNASSMAADVSSKESNAMEGTVSKAEEIMTPAVKINTEVKMGLSTDEGGRGDKSFNDAAIAGLDRIEKEFGIKPVIIESKEASQYQQNLESIANTSDLVIGVGFKMTEDVQRVAELYPDKNFLLIDGVAEGANIKNVLFKEQEGSFLLGVIAGKMTKTNKVGFIGGVEGDVIGRFESGFAAGVYSVNPEAGKLLIDRTMVSYAGNFSDVDKGTEIAKDLYSKGADIIFHAAGGVGIGLFNAAKEMNKYAMGVDSDQAAMIPDKADVILCSMIKKVDVAVYQAAKSLIEGNFVPGIENLGIKEDAVGLSPTLNPALSNNAEVMSLVEEYKAKIASGELVVPGTLAELKEFAK